MINRLCIENAAVSYCGVFFNNLLSMKIYLKNQGLVSLQWGDEFKEPACHNFYPL